MSELKINPEFKNLLFPLSDDEKRSLESSIKEDGCISPLIAWNGVLIDGHHRFEICRSLKIEFSVINKKFEDDQEVKEWILANQMSRRNLTPSEASLIRGRLYEMRRQMHGGHRPSAQSEHLNKTRDKVASETGVSAGTIWRDVEFAKAVDDLKCLDNDVIIKATRGIELNGRLIHIKQVDIVRAANALRGGNHEVAKIILSGRQVVPISNSPHVSNNSGEQEWYTPSEYIDAAREVMGDIELDPASCHFANKIIKSERFYDRNSDGLKQKWKAETLWLNPPFERTLIELFTAKLVDCINNKSVGKACALVNNATDTRWGQSIINAGSALCLLCGRVRFIDKDGKPNSAPLQGQMIIGFGIGFADFKKSFSKFGIVLRK